MTSNYKPLWQQSQSEISVKKPKEKNSGGSKLKERARLRKEAKEGKISPETKEKEVEGEEEKEVAKEEPKIVAISQVSRFHSATIETLAKEIDLKQVNISINDRELLVDCKLFIKAGTRYGFIGRNGVGKTTLFKVLAEGTLIGLPTNLRILAVQQEFDHGTDQSVLDAVMEADKDAIRTVKEAEELNKMGGDSKTLFDLNTQHSEQMVHTFGKLLSNRAYDDMVAKQMIATHRSGMRGKDARAKALAAEHAYKESLQLLTPEKKAELSSKVTSDVINELISEIFEKLSLIDLEGSKSKARVILRGLGFSEEMIDSNVAKLSGGWRMRVALAKALLYEPDTLLLDEPTNHLDLPAIKWLQNYLVNEFPSDSSVVVISHDRAFLNAVCQEIMKLRDQTLTYYQGNYDAYEEATEDLRKKKERLHAAMERRKKHMESSIAKALAHAKASGDDKRLEKFGLMKTEDGKRFKQSNRVGYHIDYKPQLVMDKPEEMVNLPIPDPDLLRHSGSLVQLEGVSFRYAPNLPLMIEDLTLNVEIHSRIALIGVNGSGKSTVMGLIQGIYKPTKGKINYHSSAQVGYFSQHQVEQLSSQPKEVSALSFLQSNHPGLTEQEGRSWLGAYGLSGKLAIAPVSKLSGGQKVRVSLADILLEGPHLLLIDEVTNHLDLQTVEALILSLNQFQGGIVLISHDQYFIESVATDFFRVKNRKLVRVKEFSSKV